VLCIKSYGDHRYIDARDICYLQADNNSTDIHLNGGEMITAFKTLKHFEGVLSYPLWIHKVILLTRVTFPGSIPETQFVISKTLR
jgi:hypothetical protein